MKNFQPGASGHIKTDIDFIREKGTIFYQFATEVAATALMGHKKKGESSEDFFHRAFELLRMGFELAIPAVSTVSGHYTIPRFR